MPTYSPGNTLRLWAFGDAHVSADKSNGRDSLAEAITHAESSGAGGGPPFAWDLAVNVGDLSGAEGVPQDEEGAEVVRQFRALIHHQREDIYDVSGNIDRSGLDEPDAWWWQKWADPLGQHPPFSGVDAAKRPYPIEGAWGCYAFRVGDLLFLMVSDRNEPSQTPGTRHPGRQSRRGGARRDLRVVAADGGSPPGGHYLLRPPLRP